MSKAPALLLALAAFDLALLAVHADPTAVAPSTGPRVGLVFDVGGRGDKSFNDAAYAGLVRLRDELHAGRAEAARAARAAVAAGLHAAKTEVRAVRTSLARADEEGAAAEAGGAGAQGAAHLNE